MVLLREDDRDIVDRLVVAIAAAPAGSPIFPYALARYRALLKQTEQSLHLSVGWGPHSPRAGWATESRAEGLPFSEIREGGRWLSDSSLRIYLDVAGADGVLTKLRQAGLEDQLRWAGSYWWAYFADEVLQASCYGAAKRQ